VKLQISVKALYGDDKKMHGRWEATFHPSRKGPEANRAELFTNAADMCNLYSITPNQGCHHRFVGKLRRARTQSRSSNGPTGPPSEVQTDANDGR